MNASGLVAVQGQPPVVVTEMVPVPGADENDAVGEDTPNEQVGVEHSGPGHTPHDTPPCEEHVPDAVCEQEYVASLQTAVGTPQETVFGITPVQAAIALLPGGCNACAETVAPMASPTTIKLPARIAIRPIIRFMAQQYTLGAG